MTSAVIGAPATAAQKGGVGGTPPQPAACALRARQAAAIVRMLERNGADSAAGSTARAPAEGQTYKILVLDARTTSIVSPLLSMNDLRRCGVTLALTLDAERQPVPDAPAVYFVEPTAHAVERIAADAKAGLYDEMHINFCSPLSRPLLEELAAALVRAGAVDRVKACFDQYLSFAALEPGCFSLLDERAFVRLNDPGASDEAVEAAVGGVADSLVAVLATAGVVPLIRAPPGGAAEMVAREVDARLRDQLAARGGTSLFADAPTGALVQPLLAIFDRNAEVAMGVQHFWAYKPLVHDVLGLRLNKVTLPGSEGVAQQQRPGAQPAGKSYQLDAADAFWTANEASPFPKVAEEVEAALSKYKADVAAVNRAEGGGDGGGDGNATAHLTSALNSLPELTDRKRVIDKHTNIATALLGSIKARSLDAFCSAEEEMYTKGVDFKEVGAMLGATARGTDEDKLRLAIMATLVAESMGGADTEMLEAKLHESNIDTAALRYARALRAAAMRAAGSSKQDLSASLLGGSGSGGGGADLLDWADKMYGKGLASITQGMKSLLGGGHKPAVARALEQLLDSKGEVETYVTLDPRAPKGAPVSAPAQGRAFREAMVFVVGGGSLQEQLSVKEVGARLTPPRGVVYGATELLSGKQFLDQMAELGSKAGG
eukprot:PRCOL_00000573-RA